MNREAKVRTKKARRTPVPARLDKEGMTTLQRARGGGAVGRCYRLCPKFMLLELHCGSAVLVPHNAATGNQPERTLVVQLSRPTDGDLHPPAWDKDVRRCEDHSTAGDIQGLPFSGFLASPFADDLIADISLNRKAVRVAAII